MCRLLVPEPVTVARSSYRAVWFEGSYGTVDMSQIEYLVLINFQL